MKKRLTDGVISSSRNAAVHIDFNLKYDSNTLTTTITTGDEGDADAKMVYMASMSTWLQVTYFLFRWKYIPQKMLNWDSE